MPRWLREDWGARGASLTAVVDAQAKAGHGRVERRELWALADPELNVYVGSAGEVGESWPHLQQVCRVERHRTIKGKTEVKVSHHQPDGN